MDRYCFIGAMRHEVEASSDEIALRIARFVTEDVNVSVARHNGKYWEPITSSTRAAFNGS